MAGRATARQRVTEYYGLGLSQGQIEFVDVPVDGDVALYIDPYALRRIPDKWADECRYLIRSFFGTVIDAIRSGRQGEARRLLGHLTEPNETRLGLSRGTRSRGRGLGGGTRAGDVAGALEASKAVQTGLLADLEDTVLMVEGIDRDIVSDIATNLIRGPLIAFTQEMAARYPRITLHEGVESGEMWNPATREWDPARFVELPVTASGKLVLVPKAIVRRTLTVNPQTYATEYLIPFLRDAEISGKTELVKLLKDKSPHVLRKDIEKKHGSRKGGLGKGDIARLTIENRELLDRYHAATDRRSEPGLDHSRLAEFTGAPTPEWDDLLKVIGDVAPGNSGAGSYHSAVYDLLVPLLDPALIWPMKEREIHTGRKRIDISFTNVGANDFWEWLSRHYTAQNIFVECKNYSGDPGNPELDQLMGRFSKKRGEVGMLMCRGFKDKKLFLQRCRDAVADDKGFILPFDDGDLAALVEARKKDGLKGVSELLKARFDALVM